MKIVIDDKILKDRIAELEKSEHLKSTWSKDNDRDKIEIQLNIYKNIIQQSEPLRPYIENAYEEYLQQRIKELEKYIENTKLEIERHENS